MPKKYIVDLSEAERKSLKKLTTTGKHAAYKINHARILLMADINQSKAIVVLINFRCDLGDRFGGMGNGEWGIGE